MILAIVDDLLFRVKLEAAAAQLETPLTIAADAESALRSGQGWSRVLIDLNLSRGDPLAMIRTLRAARLRRPALPSPTHLPVGTRARSQAYSDVPIIGYCSHVQHDLQQQALEAGCATVPPRSAFVQQLPELLSIG